MAIEAELPTTEEVNDTDGNFLAKAGTYHFSVIGADENPTYRGGEKKGQLMDGFEIEGSVLAGPEKGKSHRFFIRNPNLSHKDQGVFCKAVRGRWLEAIGVVDPSQRGKTVTIELVSSNGQVTVTGRQFIATLEQNKGNNGKDYLDLSGAKIWHVDDPSAPNCERNQDVLKLLPKSLRREAASFKAQNGNGSVKPASGQQQPAVSAGNIGDVLDSI